MFAGIQPQSQQGVRSLVDLPPRGHREGEGARDGPTPGESTAGGRALRGRLAPTRVAAAII